MRITFGGDDEGFDLQVRVKWRLLIAFLKGALAAAVVLMALLSSPVVVRLLTWFGW